MAHPGVLVRKLTLSTFTYDDMRIRFRTFMDFMDGVCSTTFVQRKPFLMSRLAYFPIFITMFFASIYIAPIQPAKTAEFHDESGFFYTVW